MEGGQLVYEGNGGGVEGGQLVMRTMGRGVVGWLMRARGEGWRAGL